MRARRRVLAWAALAVVLVVAGNLWMRARGSRRPEAAPASRLADCAKRPNCVGSLASDSARRVEPLAAAGDPEAAFGAARAVVGAMPRARLAVDERGYLRAECRSRLFGFVDDLELRLDREAERIDVRSASRTGYSDLGANRRRVERLRRRLASMQAASMPPPVARR